MRNVLYDEKIYGTVHLALGASYPFTGGSNESALHWDMVKDLRNGGQLYCDEELVQDIQAAGRKILAWTVNDKRSMVRLAGWGIDGVISDDTQLLVALCGRPKLNAFPPTI